MKEKLKRIKGILILLLLMVLSANSHLLMSVATDDNLQEREITATAKIETNLEKYINYDVDGKKGELVQIGLEAAIEYATEEDKIPLRATGILLNVPKIEGTFPESVDLIAKTTMLTNGSKNGKDYKYEYDSENGQVKIIVHNKADDEGNFYSKIQENAKDSFSLVLNYGENTYNSENIERKLKFDGQLVELAANKQKTKFKANIETEYTVTEDKSSIISSNITSNKIYNGYIKSNITNETNYVTDYAEVFELNVSKEQISDEIQINLKNALEKAGNIEETDQVIYTASAVNKEETLKILGENGYIKVIDQEGNTIGEITSQTEADANGVCKINYSENQGKLTLVVSKPETVGNLKIQNNKQIKSTMKDLDVSKVVQLQEIKCVNKEEQQVEQTNEETETKIVEKEIYKTTPTFSEEIRDSKTKVKLNVNQTEWTNERQNEVEFELELCNNKPKYNLFGDFEATIALPEETEKVILDKENLMYANGLQVEKIEYNKDTKQINIKLAGTQTKYNAESLEKGTTLTIPAVVILSQNIEEKEINLTATYKNQNSYTRTQETGSAEQTISLHNFTQELTTNNDANTQNNGQQQNAMQFSATMLRSAPIQTQTVETAEGIELEVKAIRGDAEITEQNPEVYEGEFIKYEITAKNTTSNEINDVKIAATLPEGVKYGELVREDHEPDIESYYDFDKQFGTIELGTIAAGKTKSTYFEVQVNDLPEGETQKQISTTIKSYIGNALTDEFTLAHVVKEAEYKVELESSVSTGGKFEYYINVESKNTDFVNVEMQLSECMEFDYAAVDPRKSTGNIKNSNISDDNVLTLSVKPGKYLVYVLVDYSKVPKKKNVSSVEIETIAIVKNIYKSNQNRLLLEYETVITTISSENAGEKVKYGEEINYEIKITNTGKRNYKEDNFNYIQVVALDYLPEYVKPIEVSYNNFEIDLDNKSFTEKNYTEALSEMITDENGNVLPNVKLYLNIPYQETITIHIKTIAGTVNEKTVINNTVNVSERTLEWEIEGEKINYNSTLDSPSVNTITHTILPLNYDENEEETSNTDESTELENSSESEIIENIDETTSKNNENKYNISGYVWNDQNGDGKKQENEKTISGIQTLLMDLDGNIEKIVSSGKDGSYTFSDVKIGDYLVVFRYNIDKYNITKYKVNGVNEALNSNAQKQKITIQGEEFVAGVSDEITINKDISNINLGLIEKENQKFDMKVESYINKVTVKTENETTEKNYDNVSLAKTEIKAKEVEGATVEVEYKIVITNNGDVEGTVGKVISTIPNGTEVSSNAINGWVKDSNNKYINTSLANKILKSNESAEIFIKTTQKMTENNTGIYINKVEISEMSNELNIKDINSKNNYSQTEMIISISTGAYIFIISAIIIMIIIFIANRKYGITKKLRVRILSVLSVLMLVIIAYGNISIKAIDYDKYSETTRLYLTAEDNFARNDRYRYNIDYFIDGYIYGNDDAYRNPQISSLNPQWYFKMYFDGSRDLHELYQVKDRNMSLADAQRRGEDYARKIEYSHPYGDEWVKIQNYIRESAARNGQAQPSDGIICQIKYSAEFVWFNNDWRAFYELEEGENIVGPDSDGNYDLVGGSPHYFGQCVSPNRLGGDYAINMPTSLSIRSNWIAYAGIYYRAVNAYLPLTYNWYCTGNKDRDFYNGNGSYSGTFETPEPKFNLNGNTDKVVGIHICDADNYTLGPLSITNNSQKTGYKFTINGVINDNEITACKNLDGTGKINKTYTDLTVNNSEFYLKVNKSRIDGLGGINSIRVDTQKSYSYSYRFEYRGQKLWRSYGHQDVADKNIDSYWETGGPETRVAYASLTWTSFQGTMKIKKIDEHDGNSNLSKDFKDLSGIKLKVYYEIENNVPIQYGVGLATKSWVKVNDRYGNIEYVGKESDATTFVTDNNGNAYAQIGTTSVYTLVGIDPGQIVNGQAQGREHFVKEVEIPNKFKDYYSTEERILPNENLNSGGKIVHSGEFVTYTAVNERRRTGIKITKSDWSNHRLNGIKFKIKDITEGKWVTATQNSTTKRYSYTGLKSNKSNATVFITNPTLDTIDRTTLSTANSEEGENGIILLLGLPLEKDRYGKYSQGHEYEIYECYTEGYELLYEFDEDKSVGYFKAGDGSIEKGYMDLPSTRITNIPKYGALKIVKKEPNTMTNLAGINFKIKARRRNNKNFVVGWVKCGNYGTDNDGGTCQWVEWSNDCDGGSTITTGQNGKTVKILKLPLTDDNGNELVYDIYEIGIPDDLQSYFTLSTDDNVIEFSNIDIVKNDPALPASTKENLKKIAYGGKKVVEDLELIKEIDDEHYNRAKTTYATNLKFSSNTPENQKYIANQQDYITLKGNVWQDSFDSTKGPTSRNNIKDVREKTIKGIKVSLFDRDGNIVKRNKRTGYSSYEEINQQVYTDSSGNYEFTHVPINYLKDGKYKIVFTYDGVTFESVVPFYNSQTDTYKIHDDNINDSQTSKASEKNTRQTFNNSWDELYGLGVYDGNNINIKNDVINRKELYYSSKYGDTSSGVRVKRVELERFNSDEYNNAKRYGGEYAAQTYLDGKILCGIDENDNNVEIGTDDNGKRVGIGKFLINSETFASTGTNNSLTSWYNKLLTQKKNSGSLLTEIKNINLGLYRREMPNLTLQNDIFKADVSINGKSYTYMYNKKLRTAETQQVSMAVDFDGDYSEPIYEADVNYDGNQYGNGKLEATVTYKIKLQNASTNLATEITSINEFYSKDLLLLKVQYSSKNDGTDLQDIGYGTNRAYITNSNSYNNTNDKYYQSRIIFDNPIILGAMTETAPNTQYLYVTYKINDIKKYFDNNVKNKDTSDQLGLETMFEIGSYRVKIKTGNKETYWYTGRQEYYNYAGVDETSIPNNYNPYNDPCRGGIKYDSTNEDDSDRAPGLKLVDAGARIITGVVFEDAPVTKYTYIPNPSKSNNRKLDKYDENKKEKSDGKIGALEERLGDGIYNQNSNNTNNALNSEGDQISDIPIKGVRVQLIDNNTGQPADIWIPGTTSETGHWSSTVNIYSDKNGTFKIKGFIPGNYKVAFEWGESDKFGGRDVKKYKGTVFVNPNLTLNTEDEPQDVTDLSLFENNPPRYSEAMDDYYRRLAIDHKTLNTDLNAKYIKYGNNSIEVFEKDGKYVDKDGKQYNGVVRDLYSDIEKQKIQEILNKNNGNAPTTMISSTPLMHVGIEKDGGESGTSAETPVVKGTDPIYDMEEPNAKEKFPYNIEYIDFGIIERPRHSMEVQKRIKSIKITTTEGRPVVIATIGIDGKVNAIAGESYISGGYDLGYLWAQIDKGIEQSMNVEIEYEIDVSSDSEIDYDNKEYYFFGTRRANNVRLTVDGLYDYVKGATLISGQDIWKSADLNEEGLNATYLKITNISQNMIGTITENGYMEMLKWLNSDSNTYGKNLAGIRAYFDQEKFSGYSNEQKDTMARKFDEWYTSTDKIESATNLRLLRKNKINGREIVQGTGDNKLTKDPYSPGEKRTETIKVSKQLAVGEDVLIENDVEIATSTLEKTLRTARRADMTSSPVYASAEYVTVSPATGKDKDYVGWTIVAIGILTVLGSGVILIKRMLNKK